MRDDVLWLNPLLPYELDDVRLRVRYRGHRLSLRLTDERLTVSFDRGGTSRAQIGFDGETYEAVPGESLESDLTK